MRINQYNKYVIGLMIVLFAFILLLSYVLYNSGPRVRFIQYTNDIQNTALQYNSQLSIVFDRPIEQKDYTDFVKIEPGVQFNTVSSTQSITVTLLENLRQDNTYTISLLPGVIDVSGKTMDKMFTTEFTTEPASYAYIERNYGVDDSSVVLQLDADDHIMAGEIGSQANSVFSHPEIRYFAANHDYMLIVVKEENADDLYKLNLKTKEVSYVNTPQNGRILNLTISLKGQSAVFSIQPDYSAVSEEYYLENAHVAYSLNIESDDLQKLATQSGEPIYALKLYLDTEGQVALVQDRTQNFYAVSAHNDYDPIILGLHNETFGFTQSSNEILFRDSGGYTRYSINGAESVPFKLAVIGYVQDLETYGNSILYSSSYYTDEGIQNTISQIDDWDQPETLIWMNDNNSDSILSSFSASLDTEIIALQTNSETCEYDTIGDSYSACKDSTLGIYDIQNKQIISEFRGINFVWIP